MTDPLELPPLEVRLCSFTPRGLYFKVFDPLTGELTGVRITTPKQAPPRWQCRHPDHRDPSGRTVCEHIAAVAATPMTPAEVIRSGRTLKKGTNP